MGNSSVKTKGITMYMRQAIATKYIGPSNVRGARVKASAEAGSVTLPWDHALNVDRNHAKAAETLARKFKWEGRYYGGALPGSGYCFVCVDTVSADEAVLFTVGKEG